MAKPELGTKRQCQSCGAKFYDLNKDPIICPKCSTVFQAVAPKRGPAPAAAEDEPDAEPKAGPEIVSLTEVAEGEEAKDIVVEDDIDPVADEAADDTFLEEEEEGGDDVADLIDGEIEDDEEA